MGFLVGCHLATLLGFPHPSPASTFLWCIIVFCGQRPIFLLFVVFMSLASYEKNGNQGVSAVASGWPDGCVKKNRPTCSPTHILSKLLPIFFNTIQWQWQHISSIKITFSE
jgi:hypothetical protein